MGESVVIFGRLNMNSVTTVAVVLFCLVLFSPSYARFVGLQPANEARYTTSEVGCTADQIVECQPQIQGILDDCGQLDDPMAIMTCITTGLDHLGSDCYDCICDVLPYLCWMQKDNQ